MATRLTLVHFLLLAIVLLTTETMAQPAGPINLIAILEKGGQFTTFMRLLNITQIGNQVDIQINNSFEGLTVFAPTDNAFQNLKPGTLNKLTPDEQLKLILYHIIAKFYSMDDFLSVSNPVRTQASGRDNGVYGLNITGQTNQIKVSTGYVETRISNTLREQRPLIVYVVDMVLLPGKMFGEHKLKPIAPAPKSPSGGVSDDTTKKAAASPSDKSGSDPKKHKHSPIAPAPVPVFAPIPAFAPARAPKSPSSKVSDDTSNSTQNVAASPSDKSGSGEMKVVLGFGLGLVVLCLKFLF